MIRAVPSMPILVLLPISIGSLILLIFVLRRISDTSTRFLIFAFWLRYVMSAFHFITFLPLVGGLSLNALASMGVVSISLFLVRRKYLLRKDSAYLLFFLLVVLASSILNSRIAGSANAIIKLMYLLSLTFLAYEAFQRHGVAKVMSLLCVAFLVPILLQILSYVIGPVKATEVDGSASYIGGYYHEAAFSVIIVTFLFVASFARVGRRFTSSALLVGLIGLLAANYRTTIIATAPSLIGFVVCSAALKVRPSQRSTVTFAFLALGLCLTVVAATILADRFKDIPMLIQNSSAFIKPAEYFSTMDKKVLSGRAYIWAVYLTPWLRASPMKLLFGFGADSWQDLFHLYAHNTFVSYCYEYGIMGLVSFIAILGRTASLAMRLSGVPKVVAVAGITSFVLINMATMPLWQIEGNLLFALILAYIWHMSDQSENNQQRYKSVFESRSETEARSISISA